MDRLEERGGGGEERERGRETESERKRERTRDRQTERALSTTHISRCFVWPRETNSHVQLCRQGGQVGREPTHIEHPLGADDLEVGGLPLHDVAQRLRRVELRDQALVVPGLVSAAAEGHSDVRESRRISGLDPIHQESQNLPIGRGRMREFENACL